MPRNNSEGTKLVPCQACGMLFKLRGIASHLNQNKPCRDRVKAIHYTRDHTVPDLLVADTVPCPVIAIPAAKENEPQQPPRDATNPPTANGDPLLMWHQKTYDEMETDEEKAEYVDYFTKRYGVKPPVQISSTQLWSQKHYDDLESEFEKSEYVDYFTKRHGVQPPVNYASVQSQFKSGEGNNRQRDDLDHNGEIKDRNDTNSDTNSDICILNNDDDSLDERYADSESVLHDPYYFAPMVDMTGHPTSMYPPHIEAQGTNHPPAENPNVEQVVGVLNYSELPLQVIDKSDEDEDAFSDEGSIYGSVTIDDIDHQQEIEKNAPKGTTSTNAVDVDNDGTYTPTTTIDEDTKWKVLSREYSDYNQNVPTGPTDTSLHDRHKSYRDEKISTGTIHQLRQPMCTKLASSVMLIKIMQKMNAP